MREDVITGDSSLIELPIRRIISIWSYLLGFAALGLIWVTASAVVHNNVFLPSPVHTFGALLKLARTGELAKQVIASSIRVLLAFGLGACAALALGTVMGLSRGTDAAMEPFIELFRAIPPYAMIPFALLAFGIGSGGQIFVLVYATFFPVLLNTVGGVRSVQPSLLEAAFTLGASRRFAIVRVVLPAALPQIILGLRLGFGSAWLAMIAAEMVASDNGLGFLIANAQDTINTPVVVGGMLVIGLLGYAANRLFIALERWATGRDKRGG